MSTPRASLQRRALTVMIVACVAALPLANASPVAGAGGGGDEAPLTDAPPELDTTPPSFDPGPAPAATGTVVLVDETVDFQAVVEQVAEVAEVAVADLDLIPEIAAIGIDKLVDHDALAAIGGVEQVEEDAVVQVHAFTPPDDTDYASQGSLQDAGVPGAWVRTTGSDSVTVAVLDTGVNAVSELSGALLPGRNMITKSNNVTDVFGHGTPVATVIAARADGVGTVGVCWTCKILPVKVIDDNGLGAKSHIAAGIVWAADNGADVINLSLGSPNKTTVERRATDYAANNGVLLVASAGNNGAEQIRYPASHPAVISVAASGANGLRASYSNHGIGIVDVTAPGGNYAQGSDGSYSTFHGTSFAAPVVSGVLALALAARPQVSPAALRTALQVTAIDNDFTKHGAVDAEALLFTSRTMDPDRPSVAFFRPLPGRHLGGVQHIEAVPQDTVSVDRVELLVNGTPAGVAYEAPWRVSVDTAEYPAGETQLRWRVFDRAGNASVVDRRVVFDGEPPVIDFLSHQDGDVVTRWELVTADMDDNLQSRRATLYVDGVAVANSWRAPWMAFWRTHDLPEGPVDLEWRAYDRAGNESSSTITVTVDHTKPTVRINKPWAGKIIGVAKGEQEVVQADIFDKHGVAETAVLVNGSVYDTYPGAVEEFSLNVTDLPEGRNELVLRVTDLAGNRTWSAARVFFVDNTPAEIEFVNPLPGRTVSGVVDVEAAFTDEHFVWRAQLFAGDTLLGEMIYNNAAGGWIIPWDTAAYAGKEVTLRWVAFDPAGNRSVRSRTVFVEPAAP